MWGYSLFRSYAVRLSRGIGCMLTMKAGAQHAGIRGKPRLSRPNQYKVKCTQVHIARNMLPVATPYQPNTLDYLRFHSRQHLATGLYILVEGL